MKRGITMFHVFLDLEMNPTVNINRRKNIGKKEKNMPPPALRMEIIEIGAVKLDDTYKIIDRFSCYVKPKLNQITKKVTELTGITDETLANAEELAQVMPKFVAWIGNEPVRIYSWSDTDLKQMRGECNAKGIYPYGLPENMKRWMDFQKVYTRIMGLSRSLSLANALNIIDNDFSGQQHSALADAENSAALLQLVKNKEVFKEKTKKIKAVLKPDAPLTSSIGDLLAAKLAQLQTEDRDT